MTIIEDGSGAIEYFYGKMSKVVKTLSQILPNFGTNQNQSEPIGLIPINSDKL